MKISMLVFVSALLITTGLYAEETSQKADINDWEVSETFVYDRGEYGGNTLIQTAEFDTAIKRFFEKGDVSLTVPIVTQTSDSQVTLIRGALQRVRRIRSDKVTKSGIGDMYINGSYYLLAENKDPLDISLNGYLKFPTASSNKGLGTGELDAGPGISFGKRISSEWRAFTDLYYIFIGSPSGFDLRDQTTFDLGASYDFAPELTGSIAYEESRSIIKGKENPEDLAFGIKYKLNDTTRIFGGIAFGLSDTAPELSMSIGGGIKF
jgi:hypothetical protein